MNLEGKLNEWNTTSFFLFEDVLQHFSLAQLEGRSTAEGRTGPYVFGTGEALALVDCSLAPKLFHMKIGLQHFKSNVLDVSMEYPAVAAYMKMMFARESFQASLYPEETVIWGWSNARSS